MTEEIKAPEGAIVNDKGAAKPPVRASRRKKAAAKTDATPVPADVSGEAELRATVTKLDEMKNSLEAQIRQLQQQLGAKLPENNQAAVLGPNRSLQECNKQFFEQSKQAAVEAVEAKDTVNNLFKNHVNLKTGEKVIKKALKDLK